MEKSVIEEKFKKMGAQVKVRTDREFLRLDVTTMKRKGEVFEVDIPRDATIEVLDLQPRRRHMLIVARESGNPRRPDEKTKYLVGHDERHWFVAGVPSHAITVTHAMELLKPHVVRVQQEQAKVRSKDRAKRKNEVYVRQGEWFFIPVQINVPKNLILENEPIQRGRGKPHMCRYLYRMGGDTVHANVNYPNGLTESEFSKLPSAARNAPGWGIWRRDAGVYVTGWVSHPDHKTVVLTGWHKVEPNREQGSRANAFLD